MLSFLLTWISFTLASKNIYNEIGKDVDLIRAESCINYLITHKLPACLTQPTSTCYDIDTFLYLYQNGLEEALGRRGFAVPSVIYDPEESGGLIRIMYLRRLLKPIESSSDLGIEKRLALMAPSPQFGYGNRVKSALAHLCYLRFAFHQQRLANLLHSEIYDMMLRVKISVDFLKAFSQYHPPPPNDWTGMKMVMQEIKKWFDFAKFRISCLPCLTRIPVALSESAEAKGFLAAIVFPYYKTTPDYKATDKAFQFLWDHGNQIAAYLKKNQLDLSAAIQNVSKFLFLMNQEIEGMESHHQTLLPTCIMNVKRITAIELYLKGFEFTTAERSNYFANIVRLQRLNEERFFLLAEKLQREASPPSQFLVKKVLIAYYQVPADMKLPPKIGIRYDEKRGRGEKLGVDVFVSANFAHHELLKRFIVISAAKLKGLEKSQLDLLISKIIKNFGLYK